MQDGGRGNNKRADGELDTGGLRGLSGSPEARDNCAREGDSRATGTVEVYADNRCEQRGLVLLAGRAGDSRGGGGIENGFECSETEIGTGGLA